MTTLTELCAACGHHLTTSHGDLSTCPGCPWCAEEAGAEVKWLEKAVDRSLVDRAALLDEVAKYKTLWLEAATLIGTLHGVLDIAEDSTAADILDAAQRPWREALIWCSGSPSFAPEGEAREGWVSICQPLLEVPAA